MATVTEQVSRLDAASASTNWVKIGTGGSLVVETDFFYNGSACIAYKGAASEKGVYCAPTAVDISGAGTYNTVMFKVINTTPGLIETIDQADSSEIRVGSSTADHYTAIVHGSDTYPPTTNWLIIAFDPNVTAHLKSTDGNSPGDNGTPDLTNADYYGWACDQTGTSKAENIGSAAIDIGAGLTITGTDSNWQEFVDYDEGTTTNRWGFISTKEGAIFVLGKMIIGNATATTFADNDRSIIFPESLFEAGFSGIDVGLNNASTAVTFTRISHSGGHVPNKATFEASSSGMNATTDIITTFAAHGFVSGDSVLYSKEGGTASTGITDASPYYVEYISDTTLALHVNHRESYNTNLNRLALTVPTSQERHSIVRGVDMRPTLDVSSTSGTFTSTNSNYGNFASLTFNSACTIIAGAITGSEAVTQGNAAFTGTVFASQTTLPGVALVTADNPADFVDCAFTATGYEPLISGGHAMEIDTAGTYNFSGNSFTDYGNAARTFHTTDDVNGSTEIITCDAAHGYSDGDYIIYSDEGGAVSMGLTDNTGYFVNAQSTTTLSFHTTVDDALDDLSKVNLTASGSETHAIYDSNAAIYNSSSGTVTLNIQGGGDFPNYRNDSDSTTIVQATATTKLTVEDEDGNLIQNARVLIETSDNGGGSGLAYQAAVSTLTQSAGTATLTSSGNHGLATNDYVAIRGAQPDEYNKVAQITVTSDTVFTYSVDTGASTPATGTPVFSYAALAGLTDVNGEIEASKAWPASQGLSGWVRKSSASPYFKQTMLNIADASAGTDLLVALQPDE